MLRPRIAVVGVCASGKTTLVKRLQALGYEAWSVPQEHSCVAELWLRRQPDFLVLLDCTDQTACRRRRLAGGAVTLADQRQRLARARRRCHLAIATDTLSPGEILARVLARLRTWSPPSGAGPPDPP